MNPSTRHTLVLALALPALTVLFAFPALAQDAEGHEAGGTDMEAAMAAMEKAAAPGEPHRFLAGLEGEWTFTNTMWMDPSQPPIKSAGMAKKAMLMDGRYLQEEISGEAMGQPFSGRGVTAYDNTAGEFITTWIDNMGTSIAIVKGQRDGKTLTLHGEYLDPESKQPMKVRYVTRIVDQDHHVFQYFMTYPGAPEFKSMEIEYARKASE